jgi:ATP-dependent Clp protease adaptor protein ClpS
MFDSLAEVMASGSGEWIAAFAVLLVAGGLVLGYLLAGAFTRSPRHSGFAEDESPGEPRYAVVLHNDDFNTFGFVIGVLGQVFAYGGLRGLWHALKVHCAGRGVIWSGTLAAAEIKADQVRSCGADPNGRAGVQPLRVTVEPLPS